MALAWPAVWLRFDAAYRWPWVLIAAGVLIVIVFRLRSHFSPTSAFRLLAIAGMWVALLEPVIGRPRNPTEAGPILLLLDVSQSMTAHDRLRTPRQRVALARALGRLPNDTTDSSLVRARATVNELARHVEVVTSARAELDYARLLGRRSPELRNHFETAIAALRKEALTNADPSKLKNRRLRDDVVALAGPGSAPGLARDNWLNHLGDLLRAVRGDLDRVADEADAVSYQSRSDVRAACDAVSELSRLELERLAALRVERSMLVAFGEKMPVQAVAFGNGTRAINLRTVDLNDVSRSPLGGKTQLNLAARAAATDANEPVLASVLFSDGRPVGDVAGEDRSGSESSWPVFTVRVAKAGALRDVSLSNLSLPTWAYLGQEVYARVQLQPAGLSSAAIGLRCQLGRSTREQVIDANDNTAVVARPHVVANDVGIQAFKVTAVPGAGDAIEGSGALERALRVIDRSVNVLLISDAENGSEQKYLASLPFVRLAVAPVGKPLKPAEILSADVVVISGFDPQQLPPLAWAALRHSVHDSGAGVVFLADSTDSMADVDNAPAAELVPWEPGTQGSHRTPATPEMTLQTAGAEVGPLLGPLPLADQWLADEPLPAGQSSLLIDGETRTPILIDKRVGAGRSLLLTVTPAAVKSPEQSAMVRRLWTIIIRNAASLPFAVGTDGRKLDVDPPAGDPEMSFRVRCETTGSTPPRIDVRQDGRWVRQLVMQITTRSADAVAASTTITHLPAGHYAVSFSGTETPQVEFDVAPQASGEMENLTGRSDVLRRLARGSDGAFFELEDCDALVNRLKTVALAPRPPVEWRLAAAPPLLVFIVGCLAIDWSLRKRAGLA